MGLYKISTRFLQSSEMPLNELKRIQQKLTRYERHLENYSFLIRRKVVPHGLLPKTRPAFDSHNPYFFRSWKQNQQHFALQQLKLLIQECKIKTKDLRRDEIKFKNKLRSACNDSTTYTALTDKLSNHISNLTRKLKDKLFTKASDSYRRTQMSSQHARPTRLTTSTRHAS